MSLLRQVIKQTMDIVLPQSRLLIRGRLTNTSLSSEKAKAAISVSLTFDDGPHPEWTPPVLDALDEAGWIGTFFVIGRDVSAHPELVREIVQRGHEIGNHTYTHSEPATTNAAQLVDEVTRTQELITEATGQTVSLMRPPKGRLSLSKMSSLWKVGQTITLWNVDTKDFEMTSAEEADAWAAEYQPMGGDIVLLHDRLPYAVEFVRELSRIHGHAIRSVPISSWLPEPQHAQQSSNCVTAGSC